VAAVVSIASLFVLYYLSQETELRSSKRYALFPFSFVPEIQFPLSRLVHRLISIAIKSGTFTALNAWAILGTYLSGRSDSMY
jgi:hypothetical protein